MKASVDMAEGVIWRQLYLYALPILLGELFQQFYNMADTIVVGNWVSADAMAAVGGTSSVTKVLIGFFNGVSVGCTVVVAQCFGAKNREKLRQSVHTILSLSVGFGILLSAVGILITPPVLRLLETPQEVFPLAVLYLRVYFAGMLGLILYNTITGILRAVGNVRLPFLALLLSSAINIVLDLLFVIRFSWGVVGVAVATILAQVISALCCLYALTQGGEESLFQFGQSKFDLSVAKEVLVIGVPTGVQKILTALSNVVVLSYINFFGNASLAGWVVYTKVNHFIVVALQSIGTSITTFVSQNVGAGQYRRAEKGVSVGFWSALALTVLLSVLILLFHCPIAELFGVDSEMQYYASLYLSGLILLQVFHVPQSIFSAALRGLGEAVKTTVVMLFCLIVVRQIYLFAITQHINTPLIVGLSFPLGWLLSGVSLLALYRMKIRGYTSSGRKD